MVLTAMIYNYLPLFQKVCLDIIFMLLSIIYTVPYLTSFFFFSFIGYRCRVLCLDLKYHGMYRLVDIGTFYIPSSSNNMDTMLGVSQVMNYVKVSYCDYFTINGLE